MKLNLGGMPEDLARWSSGPEPGDVYRKAGGQPGFWVIISMRANGDCYVLAYDVAGELTGAGRFAASYFADRPNRLVGHVALPDFDVEWRPGQS
jgi:hypothetical protein